MGTCNNVVVGLQATATLKVGDYGDVEGSAVDVGFIKGGIKIEKSEERLDVAVDQVIGHIKSITTHEEMKITLSIAEATMENLAVAMGYPTSAVSSGVLYFGGKTSNTERTLYINVKGINGGNRKITIHKAIPVGNTSQEYKKDEETLIDVEFKVLVDCSQPAEQQMATEEETGTDTTAPTVAMTTPADGGTVDSGSSDTVLLTFTEAVAMDVNSLIYGDTIIINNVTTPASAVFVAGTVSYNATAKTLTFTPTVAWNASDDFQITVSTGVRDMNNNNLAAPFIGQFSVTA